MISKLAPLHTILFSLKKALGNRFSIFGAVPHSFHFRCQPSFPAVESTILQHYLLTHIRVPSRFQLKFVIHIKIQHRFKKSDFAKRLLKMYSIKKLFGRNLTPTQTWQAFKTVALKNYVRIIMFLSHKKVKKGYKKCNQCHLEFTGQFIFTVRSSLFHYLFSYPASAAHM